MNSKKDMRIDYNCLLAPPATSYGETHPPVGSVSDGPIMPMCTLSFKESYEPLNTERERWILGHKKNVVRNPRLVCRSLRAGSDFTSDNPHGRTCEATSSRIQYWTSIDIRRGHVPVKESRSSGSMQRTKAEEYPSSYLCRSQWRHSSPSSWLSSL